MSKLQSDTLGDAILAITTKAKDKKRNFVDTVELQIGLKNNDPQKEDKLSVVL